VEAREGGTSRKPMQRFCNVGIERTKQKVGPTNNVKLDWVWGPVGSAEPERRGQIGEKEKPAAKAPASPGERGALMSRLTRVREPEQGTNE